MIALGHHGWTLNFTNDYYCWQGKRTIDICLDYPGDVRQMILHEIAHIDTAKYCNQRHNPDFWKRYEYLTRRFLRSDIDENNKKHKNYMTIGYYNLAYGPKKYRYGKTS